VHARVLSPVHLSLAGAIEEVPAVQGGCATCTPASMMARCHRALCCAAMPACSAAQHADSSPCTLPASMALLLQGMFPSTASCDLLEESTAANATAPSISWQDTVPAGPWLQPSHLSISQAASGLARFAALSHPHICSTVSRTSPPWHLRTCRATPRSFSTASPLMAATSSCSCHQPRRHHLHMQFQAPPAA
jgi:hypothetical protein